MQYEVITHIVLLHDKKGTEALETAEALYTELQDAGIEVLFDDRNESPGVKFNDADLIGIPVRLTVGRRALDQGGIEFRIRGENDSEIVPVGQVKEKLDVV